MKTPSSRCSLLVMVVILALLLTMGAEVHSPTILTASSEPQTEVTDPAALAQRVIELANLERAAAGLPPLKANEALSQAAKAHSLAMAERDFFDHQDPSTGAAPGDRAKAAGYAWSTVAENIAIGYATPEEVITGWMNSEGHRQNLLNPEYREIGVGYVAGPGSQSGCQNQPCQHYWAQVFGARNDVFPLIINDEAAVIAGTEVSLYIYGQGWAQEMRLRNDSESFTPWEPYTPTRTWTLPASEGLHAVEVELRNANGDIISSEDTVLMGTAATPTPLSGQQTAMSTPAPGQGQSGGSGPLQFERRAGTSSLIAGEEGEVVLLLTGDPDICGEQIVRSPLDIALVIDHSGSMGDSTGLGSMTAKLEAAKQAAIGFLNAVDLGTDQVAVISFDDRARLEQGLDTRANAISDAIAALQTGGGTNIADGLLAGLDELTGKRRRQDAAGIIILLSDGQSPAQAAAQQAKSQGVRIITIGLGQDVDENELRAAASAPTDYYFSPEVDQLDGIFQVIARTIRESPAAGDVTVTHRIDVTNFEVIPDSIDPQGQLAFDRIIWRLPAVGDEVITLRYRVRARVPGSFDLDLGDKVEYRECGNAPQVIELSAGLPLQVAQDPNATPIPIPTPIPEPVTPVQAAFNLLCGDFPWWLLLPLILFLIALALIWFANLGGWRQQWTERWRACPKCCVLANLLLLAYLFFLLALLLRALQPAICQTKAAVYFWEVTPEGESSILYKPIEPDLPVREFTALNKQADCIACHNVALNADVIAAIADGSNGPVTTMRLDGTLIATPPINASYLALSPDGKQLAYAAEGKDIFILDIESGATVSLAGASDPTFVETMPAWSSDGATIAFVRTTGEVRGYALAVPSDIFTVPATGGTATLLPGAGNGGFNYYPAYSPDGRWLAFTRHTTGSSTRADPQAEVYLVPAQGGQALRLAANDLAGGQTLIGASNSWPTWSPDGRSLAFNTKRNGGQFDIYVTQIDPDGNASPARPLSGAARPDRFEHLPQWGRPPQVNLLARLFGVLPWLLGLPLLWLLRRWACRDRFLPPTVRLAREVSPSTGLENEQVFHIRLTLTGDNSGCDEVRIRKPVDVVLAIDVSGSMDSEARAGLGERKIDGARNAATAFLQKMDPNQDRVGLVAFDDSAQIVQSLEADMRDVEKAIKNLQSNGGTAIHEGLNAALDEIKMFRRAEVPGVIILLSDGGSEVEPALKTAELIRDEGIRLITVAFGADADPDLLRQLATSPQDFHASASNRQLEQAFQSIAEQIQDPPAATDVTFVHRIDMASFVPDFDSIFPRPQKIDGGMITWYFAELSTPRTVRYQVRGKTPGKDRNVDLGDVVRYKRCGDLPSEITETAGLPVEILARGEIPPITVHKRAIPPEPLEVPDRKPVWEPDSVLIIGAGAFGRQMLTHLKKNLRDAGNGVIPERVQFLLLDTAQYGDGGKPLTYAGVALAESEVVVLDENLRPLIQRILNQGDGAPSYLQDWFPAESYVGAAQTHNLAAGTHGERPIARAGLIRRLNGDVKTTDTTLIDRLQKALTFVNAPPQGVRAVLVGSLSEGMGATLWDLAYLVRKMGSHHLPNDTAIAIEGYLSFETHQGSHDPIEDAELNAMAALRELGWFQLNPGFPSRFHYGGDGKLDNTLKPLSERLIDDLYLFVTGFDEQARIVWPAAADLITLRLDKNLRQSWDLNWYDLRRSAAQRSEARERRIYFGTGGSAVIRLPAYDIIETVKVRWAREMVQQFLMGDIREQPKFSAQYVTDPGLPTDPGALVLTFLQGFVEGDRYDIGVEAPFALRRLGLMLVGKTAAAAKLTGADEPDNIATYLGAMSSYLLTGTDAADRTQVRAGKIGYTTEFLSALKLTCEGELLKIIKQSQLQVEVQNDCEKARQQLITAIDAQLERVEAIKLYLGKVYAALENKEQDLRVWRQEMDATPNRRYLWDETLDPAGKRLAVPKPLAEIWYDIAYQTCPPQKHAHYLCWDATSTAAMDLSLLLPSGEWIHSTQRTAEEFANYLLVFAGALLQVLWKTDLATVAERIFDNPAALAGELQGQARPLSARRANFEAGPVTERRVVAISTPTKPALQALTDTFPPTVSDAGGAVVDWKRLPLTDRFSWQLVHTQDDLTPARLHRYARIHQVLTGEDRRRSVFGWEAVAKRERERYAGELLHPIIAAALVDDDRAHLYGLAYASAMVHQSTTQWSIRRSPADAAIVQWNPTAHWDGGVYGLLYFVYRATSTQVETVKALVDAPTEAMKQSWLSMAMRQAFSLRQPNDTDDIYSLRLLAWFAARRQVGKLRL